MSTNVSDKDLWNGIKNGSQESLAQLFQRYYFYLVKTGITYARDAELAKDAANDVFYNLWRNRENLSEVGNVKAYLNTSFRNQVFALLGRDLKSRQKMEQWQDEQPGTQLSYEEMLVATQLMEEQKEKVRRAFTQLTPRQKEYLELKFYHGLSYEKIAETTGQAIKTVYNTVYEAIKVLRSEMRL